MSCLTRRTELHFPLETTSCSCKQDTKEWYLGQQFWQMERDISVRQIEMTGPVKVDHLHVSFHVCHLYTVFKPLLVMFFVRM